MLQLQGEHLPPGASWSQTEEDVEVAVALPEGCSRADLEVLCDHFAYFPSMPALMSTRPPACAFANAR